MISFLSFLPLFFSNPWLSTLISTAVGCSHQCTHTQSDSAAWQWMLFKALVFSLRFNRTTLRSELIKEDTESLSVWSSRGDAVLRWLVLTRRACIIEGKRWIRMMSWLDCGAPLGGNAVRETSSGITILRGVGHWGSGEAVERVETVGRQRQRSHLLFYLKRNGEQDVSMPRHKGLMIACELRKWLWIGLKIKGLIQSRLTVVYLLAGKKVPWLIYCCVCLSL